MLTYPCQLTWPSIIQSSTCQSLISNIEYLDEEKINCIGRLFIENNQALYDIFNSSSRLPVVQLFGNILVQPNLNADIKRKITSVFINYLSFSDDLTPVLRLPGIDKLAFASRFIFSNKYFLNTCPAQKAFFTACKQGNLKLAKTFATNPSFKDLLTKKNAAHWSALAYACTSKNDELVSWLIDQGADIETTFVKNETIAHVIAESGSLASFKLVFTKNRKFCSVENGECATPLMVAAAANRTEIVDFLLQNTDTALYTNKRNQTALHYAAQSGSFDAFNLILTHLEQSLLPIPQSLYFTAFVEACKCTHRGGPIALALFKKDPGCARQTLEGVPGFHFACAHGHLALVNEMLNADPTLLNSLSSEETTSLIYACNNNHPDLAIELINKGADYTKKNNKKQNLLHFACIHGQLDLVKHILLKEQNRKATTDFKNHLITQRCNQNMTPLMYACAQGHMNVIKYLLDNLPASLINSLAEHKDTDGQNALHFACKIQDMEASAIEKLMTPETINSTTQKKQTAFELACQAQNSPLASFLHKRGASLFSDRPQKLSSQALTILEHVFYSAYLDLNLDEKRSLSQALELTLQVWNLVGITTLPSIKLELIRKCEDFSYFSNELAVYSLQLQNSNQVNELETNLLKAAEYIEYGSSLQRFFIRLLGELPTEFPISSLQNLSNLIREATGRLRRLKQYQLLADESSFKKATAIEILTAWNSKHLFDSLSIFNSSLNNGSALINNANVNPAIFLLKQAGRSYAEIYKSCQERAQLSNNNNNFFHSVLQKENPTIDEMLQAEINHNVSQLKKYIRTLRPNKRIKT